MESTLFQLVRTPMYIYGAMEKSQILLLFFILKPKGLDLLNVSPPMHPWQQPGVGSQITTELSRFLHHLAYLSRKVDQFPRETRRGQRKI